MWYGPEARAVEPPFNHRLAIPWVDWGENGLEFYYPWGLSTTSYKLFVIAAALAILTAFWALLTRTKSSKSSPNSA